MVYILLLLTLSFLIAPFFSAFSKPCMSLVEFLKISDRHIVFFCFYKFSNKNVRAHCRLFFIQVSLQPMMITYFVPPRSIRAPSFWIFLNIKCQKFHRVTKLFLKFPKAFSEMNFAPFLCFQSIDSIWIDLSELICEFFIFEKSSIEQSSTILKILFHCIAPRHFSQSVIESL